MDNPTTSGTVSKGKLLKITEVKNNADEILGSAGSLYEFVRGIVDDYCGEADPPAPGELWMTMDEKLNSPSGYIDQINDTLDRVKTMLCQTRIEVERL